MQNEMLDLSFSHSKKKKDYYRYMYLSQVLYWLLMHISENFLLTFISIDIDLMANHDYNLHQVVEGFIKINK